MTREKLRLNTPEAQPEKAEPQPQIRDCDACKFYQHPKPTSATFKGECRFHAPKVFYDDGTVTSWPKTDPDDWCREWRRRA